MMCESERRTQPREAGCDSGQGGLCGRWCMEGSADMPHMAEGTRHRLAASSEESSNVRLKLVSHKRLLAETIILFKQVIKFSG